MEETHQFTRVDFHKFKAFEQFSLHLRHFNILVGPNNADKSTILAAFRILAAALRKAGSRKPELIPGNVYGYRIDLSSVSVAQENIFFNYDDSEEASVRFRLSNNNTFTLLFPERDVCYLVSGGESNTPKSPTTFKKYYNCSIGFVPILGPVDHNENLGNGVRPMGYGFEKRIA